MNVLIKDLGIEVPEWIDQNITDDDVQAICEGGCASGAYMPAVTYYDALATMSRHGESVFDMIVDCYGEIEPPPQEALASFAHIAVHYLSLAVELWCSTIDDEVNDG